MDRTLTYRGHFNLLHRFFYTHNMFYSLLFLLQTDDGGWTYSQAETLCSGLGMSLSKYTTQAQFDHISDIVGRSTPCVLAMSHFFYHSQLISNVRKLV